MKKLNQFVCILKSGGDYKPCHVQDLKKNVEWALPNLDSFICISDMYIQGVNTIPLKRNYRGWWSMHEAYRIKGKVIITGIDTVFVKQSSQLFEIAETLGQNEVYMIRSTTHPERNISNGIQIWNGDLTSIYNVYDIKDGQIRHYGEQEYSIELLQNNGFSIKALNTGLVPGIYSYKKHCRRQRILPKGANIIIFHGCPRPFQVVKNEQWIRDIYEKCGINYKKYIKN